MKFSTLTIVSMITGKMLGSIDDAYRILDFMTDDSIFTHQIPRAQKVCGEELKKQFPQFAAIRPQEINTANAADFSLNLIENFGAEFDVSPLPAGVWQKRDPIEDLLDMQIHGREPQK